MPMLESNGWCHAGDVHLLNTVYGINSSVYPFVSCYSVTCLIFCQCSALFMVWFPELQSNFLIFYFFYLTCVFCDIKKPPINTHNLLCPGLTNHPKSQSLGSNLNTIRNYLFPINNDGLCYAMPFPPQQSLSLHTASKNITFSASWESFYSHLNPQIYLVIDYSSGLSQTSDERDHLHVGSVFLALIILQSRSVIWRQEQKHLVKDWTLNISYLYWTINILLC